MHAPGPHLVIKALGADSRAVLLALGSGLAPIHNSIHAICMRPCSYPPNFHTMSPSLPIVWLPPKGYSMIFLKQYDPQDAVQAHATDCTEVLKVPCAIPP